MIKQIQKRWLFAMIISLLAFSCSEDEVPPLAIASFQFEVSATDFRVVNFTNFSQNAVSYSWNFGDGSAASTVENPSHTFATEGTYKVVLTATGAGGDQSIKEEQVVVADPNIELKKLTGTTSKTWKLIRDVSTGRYPFEVGPANRAEIWYALGLQEDLSKRPCMLNDEFIFNISGSFQYKTNGDIYGHGGVWNSSITGVPGCISNAPGNFVNVDNVNISAWNDGTHAFVYDFQNAKLTVNGLGAFLGMPQVATNNEVKVPQNSVTYNVVKLVDAAVDTLIVETTLTSANGYWRFVLVHYDNPLDEPAMPTDVSPPFGTDLPDITPTTMGHTFESATSFDLLGAFSGASIITPGVNDPVNSANTKVGKFERVAGIQYQEAKLRTAPDLKDIQFNNMTKVSMDVYLPSTNDYTGLNKKVVIGLADESRTEQWWTRIIQYESADLALDSWVTVTFQLNAPAYAAENDTPFDRNDLDMVYITIGGTDRQTGGTFYIRNLKFE